MTLQENNRALESAAVALRVTLAMMAAAKPWMNDLQRLRSLHESVEMALKTRPLTDRERLHLEAVALLLDQRLP